MKKLAMNGVFIIILLSIVLLASESIVQIRSSHGGGYAPALNFSAKLLQETNDFNKYRVTVTNTTTQELSILSVLVDYDFNIESTIFSKIKVEAEPEDKTRLKPNEKANFIAIFPKFEELARVQKENKLEIIIRTAKSDNQLGPEYSGAIEVSR